MTAVHPKQESNAQLPQYSVCMRPTSFDIIFTNKDPATNTLQKTNVFVESVGKYSPCSCQIIIGSKLIKLQHKCVEGLKYNEIMKLVKITYADCMASKLKLKMIFRKPENYSNPKSNSVFNSQQRTVFLDINVFYKIWRTLPSNILLNSLLIFANIEIERILQTKKTFDAYYDEYNQILNDLVFRNLLQWKNEQGLLLTINKTSNLLFWFRLSKLLMSLSDPSTYKNKRYSALQLDIKYYENISSFKYNVTLNDIKQTINLSSDHVNINAIKEILYRSNPSLNIYEHVEMRNNHQKHAIDAYLDPLSKYLSETEFDAILDEIDTFAD